MYEDRTHDTILDDSIESLSGTDVDKSEGSLVYNALSAMGYEHEKLYVQLDFLLGNIFAQDADYEHLCKRVAERGIYPRAATYAVIKAQFDVAVGAGSRFAHDNLYYVVTELLDGSLHIYSLTCETAGVSGNVSSGVLDAVDYVDGLNSAEIIGLISAASDAEKKEDLYQRYVESFKLNAFGGNVADYKERLNAMDGIGGCKVFPVWKGGGTVKAVLIGSDYRRVSEELVKKIQELVCPVPYAGEGIAPIGHDTTIASAEEVTCDIHANIAYETGHSMNDLRPAIYDAVNEYFMGMRESWGDGDKDAYLTVYISRIASRILDVSGIVDVTDVSINGLQALALEPEQIPVLGVIEDG